MKGCAILFKQVITLLFFSPSYFLAVQIIGQLKCHKITLKLNRLACFYITVSRQDNTMDFLFKCKVSACIIFRKRLKVTFRWKIKLGL